MRFLKPVLFISVFVVLLNLTSCSFTQLAYNYGDFLLLRQIDRYFQVDSQQKVFLKQQLKQFFAWHRQAELPLYAKLLSELKTKAQDGVTQEELEWAFAQFEARRRELFLYLLPTAATFFTTLQPQQLDYFEKEFVKAVPPDQPALSDSDQQRRLEERSEKTIDKMQDWFGRLTDGQIFRIQNLSFALPDVKQEWIDYRETRRREFVTFLRQNPSAEAIIAYLKPWLIHPREAYLPQYKAKFLEMEAAVKTMILQVDKLITASQRKKALKRLSGYIKDFKKLSRQ
jgi:hypothetical protein